MPANLSARALLWIGIGVIAVSMISQTTIDLVWRAAGNDWMTGAMSSWWYPFYQLVPTVLIPLGALVVAASFVARALEGDVRADSTTDRLGTRAAWLFWTGLVLTILGLVVGASLQDWLTDLNAQGRTSLALDVLTLIVIPLRMVILPLGLALLPSAVLVKKISALRVESARAQLPR